jgi:hypothetical protein
MPHQKEVQLNFLSSSVLEIIGVAMLVGLTIGEQLKTWFGRSDK